MKAIIVDDEPKAIELLRGYLSHFNGVELIGTFRNGLKAFEFISKEAVDVIFLDINMPHISGISLAKMINTKAKVIFTTAYADFAVESYEVNAIDYLLKPISLERFTSTMSKLLSEKSITHSENPSVIAVKSGSKTHLINPEEIQFLEKDGNYIMYYVGSKKIMARASVSEALAQLPDYFIQVQRSYIVNARAITSVDKDHLNIDSVNIPIGANYRETLKHHLNIQ